MIYCHADILAAFPLLTFNETEYMDMKEMRMKSVW